MKAAFFLREALRSMRRNAVPSFAAFASVLVTVLVLGVFIPVVEVTNAASNDVRNRVLVEVFLKGNDTSADIARVGRELRAAPHIKGAKFKSKAAAYQEQVKLDPGAYAVLGPGNNPLPDAYVVTPDTPDNSNVVANELSPLSRAGPGGTRVVSDGAIASVRNNRSETNKVLRVTSIVTLTMAGLAVLLVLASVLLVSNTIRLSLFARRREVEVMKLVGATDWFIRWPFVIEGVMLGALGGLTAIVLLLIAKVALIDPLLGAIRVIADANAIAFPLLVVVLLASSVGVAAAGSSLSLRRFLRV